jgi:hypothetical protein
MNTELHTPSAEAKAFCEALVDFFTWEAEADLEAYERYLDEELAAREIRDGGEIFDEELGDLPDSPLRYAVIATWWPEGRCVSTKADNPF